MSGTLTQSILDSSQEAVDTETHGLDGVLSDGAITLQIGGDFLGNTLSGTVGPDSLTLNILQTDGTFRIWEFIPAQASDYNLAVEELQSVAVQNRAIGDENRELLAKQTSLDDAAESVDTAMAEVADSIDSLSNELPTLEADLQIVRDDTQAVRAAVAAVKKSAADTDEICFEVYDVGFQSDKVGFDRDTVEYDVDSYAADSLEDDASELRIAWDALDAARTALPTYEPVVTASNADIDARLTAATAALLDWQQASEDAMSEATSLAEEAEGLAEAIATELDC